MRSCRWCIGPLVDAGESSFTQRASSWRVRWPSEKRLLASHDNVFHVEHCADKVIILSLQGLARIPPDRTATPHMNVVPVQESPHYG